MCKEAFAPLGFVFMSFKLFFCDSFSEKPGTESFFPTQKLYSLKTFF